MYIIACNNNVLWDQRKRFLYLFDMYGANMCYLTRNRHRRDTGISMAIHTRVKDKLREATSTK